MTLPIAYMAPAEWYRAYLRCPGKVVIEGFESFEKQTFRNRCLITPPFSHGREKDTGIMLSVPVKKVEHKQLTRDIEISYQSRWQHQHWISLVSAYKHTPYFDYYEEFFKPFYEKETKWLWDLNNGLHEVIMALLCNERPDWATDFRPFAYKCTTDWENGELNRYYGNGKSILDDLFEFGPETTGHLR